jgi:hypothetical protein
MSKFARMLGVSPQMVDKIRDRLTLVMVSGAKKKHVDLLGAETVEYLQATGKLEKVREDVELEQKLDETIAELLGS